MRSAPRCDKLRDFVAHRSDAALRALHKSLLNKGTHWVGFSTRKRRNLAHPRPGKTPLWLWRRDSDVLSPHSGARPSPVPLGRVRRRVVVVFCDS
jgi:hypothetical protein